MLLTYARRAIGNAVFVAFCAGTSVAQSDSTAAAIAKYLTNPIHRNRPPVFLRRSVVNLRS